MSGSGESPADTICTEPGSNTQTKQESPNWPEPPYLHPYQFLHFQDLTSIISAAHSGGLHGTSRLVHEHSRGLRMAPRSWVSGCTRPTTQGSLASINSVWCQQSIQPPILRNHWLLLGVVPRMVVLRLVVCTDRAVTCGNRCDSGLFSANLVCKDSCWWSNLPDMVQCACSQVSSTV